MPAKDWRSTAAGRKRMSTSSKAWAGGSSRAWRKVRMHVLERDQWVCQLCGKRIPRGVKSPHPLSAAVHHTLGRAVTGDDPRFLVATHRECNTAAGDPRAVDPAPRPRTQW